MAALYNLSLWIVGLTVIQQIRYVLGSDELRRNAILRAGYWAFVFFVALGTTAVVLAYVNHRFSLALPSVFGLLLGHAVPEGAVIVEQATKLVFARPDWGLPGVPMPRLTIYGPYPTATGAIAAVCGTMALLYLQFVRRAPAVAIFAFEGLIVLDAGVHADALDSSRLARWMGDRELGVRHHLPPHRRLCRSGGGIAACYVSRSFRRRRVSPVQFGKPTKELHASIYRDRGGESGCGARH